jgi:hypothetical protein
MVGKVNFDLDSIKKVRGLWFLWKKAGLVNFKRRLIENCCHYVYRTIIFTTRRNTFIYCRIVNNRYPMPWEKPSFKNNKLQGFTQETLKETRGNKKRNVSFPLSET